MIKKYVGGISTFLGVIGTIGGYIAMALTTITFVVLFITKLIGIFEGPWFALTEVSVIITPLYLFFGGLISFLVSALTAAVGSDIYTREKNLEKKRKKYIDTEEIT
jgi:hypothetical protein